jgi:hypothetical protein
MTYKMNKKQFDSVIKLDAPKRYQHFISRISDLEELWSLKNKDGYVMLADDNGNKCLAFWPHPDYAKALLKDEWIDCAPDKIDLYNFLNNWLSGMEKDGFNVAVFPTPDSKGIIVDPIRLKKDIEKECEQYE